MPRFLPLLTLAALAVSCRPPAYRPPAPDEPHVVLKVRHVVHRHRGPQYESVVRLGEWAIDERTVPTTNESGAFHLRIRPERAALRIGGASYHYERRPVTRYRSEQETYSCSEYQCTGFGTSRQCGTRMTTCTRTRQRAYTVWEDTQVIDDSCGASLWIDPRPGATYLVQFDYVGENECSIHCFEQRSTLNGEFRMLPCSQVSAGGEEGVAYPAR